MIEITLAQLRSPSFSKSYQKLMSTTGFDPKTAYHVARVGQALEAELTIANQAYDKLIADWAETKEENGQKMWRVPDEKLEGFTAANKSFHEAVVSVPKRKLLVGELEKAALTPSEYLALEPVLASLEELEGGNSGS